MRPDHLFSGFYRLALFLALPANASEGIDIVGSSTVYPFSTVAAERFAQITGGRSPKVESTGSGRRIGTVLRRLRRKNARYYQRFAADKKIRSKNCAPKTALAKCWKLKSAMTALSSRKAYRERPFALTRRELFLALGRDIPGPDGFLQPNPNKKWA